MSTTPDLANEEAAAAALPWLPSGATAFVVMHADFDLPDERRFQWTHSADAGQGSYFITWTDPIAARRKAVAEAFARIARNLAGVQEVWLVGSLPDLEVGVVLGEPDLHRELELRGIFIELVCDELDASVGELFVYPEARVPDWLREGERLT